VFGSAIDYARITIVRRKWYPLQPKRITMTPRGHIHFHPQSDNYCDDFAGADWGRKGLLVHELTHAWQTQSRGEWYLVLHRHPLCRYDYSLKPGWMLERYGIEQQAEIVRHAFLLRHGVRVPGIGDPATYDLLVNFPGAR
jgi:hypothetical protein